MMKCSAGLGTKPTDRANDQNAGWNTQSHHSNVNISLIVQTVPAGHCFRIFETPDRVCTKEPVFSESVVGSP